MTPTRPRLVALAATGCALALALSACGSTSASTHSSGGSGASGSIDQATIEAAKAAVAAAREPVADFKAPSVSAGPVPRGELVSVVTALNAANLPYDVA